MACDRPDVEELLAGADRALAIAVEHGDVALEARALADGGLALVSQGRTRAGFARLEAALATISAGGVDWDAAGLVLLLDAHRLRPRRRPASGPLEWTRLVDAAHRPHGRPARGSCTPTAASPTARCCAPPGRWPEAEAQLLDALGPADSPTIAHRPLDDRPPRRPPPRPGPRRRGRRPAGRRSRTGSRAARPLARVHRARGDLDLAAAVARRGVSEMVGDALRSAPLLVAARRGRARAGRPRRGGRAAADELAAAGRRSSISLPVQPSADAARRPGADGRRRPRRRPSSVRGRPRPRLVGEDAPDGTRHRAPGAGRGAGRRGRRSAAAIAEARAASPCFDRLGARAARDRADALLRSWGDTGRSVPGDAVAAVGALTRREREVLDAVARGPDQRPDRRRLFISPKTVEHHVGRVLAKLGVRSRAEAAALSVRRSPRPPTGNQGSRIGGSPDAVRPRSGGCWS